METSESQPKNYELAFHLVPELNDSEVTKEAQEIESMVKKIGGNVIAFRQPMRTRLSYTIKQKGSAYFGFINFSALPEFIKGLDSEIKAHTPVLRHMILQRELQEKKLATVVPPVVTHKAQKVKEEVAESEEAIEKELEEVLEKI